MIDPDEKFWWVMCGNDVSLRLYGPMPRRELAVEDAEFNLECAGEHRSHRIGEFSAREIARLLKRERDLFIVGSTVYDWATELCKPGETILRQTWQGYHSLDLAHGVYHAILDLQRELVGA